MLPPLFRNGRPGAPAGQPEVALPAEGSAGPTAPPARSRPVFHPFLIAAFPVLSLYAHNVYEAPLRALLAPLGLALVGALATWLVFRLVGRDAQRAGLATSLVAAIFFTYDRVSLALDEAVSRASAVWIEGRYRVPIWGVVAVMTLAAAPAVWAIFRRLKDPARWTAALNGFGLILVALPLGSIAMTRLREPARAVIRGEGAATAAPAGKRPDIYYIMLDGYARSDVLKDLFDVDNADFLRRLRTKGFFVAGRSTSNYCHTRLSIASTLNFDYLDRLLDPSSRDPNPLDAMIADNHVVKALRPLGYRFVSFATGFGPTECPEADAYLTPRFPTEGFRRMAAGMTPLGPLLYSEEIHDAYAHYRERTLFTLENLPEIARMEGPTFTFAHIVCPHPPFSFGEDGEDVSPRDKSLFPTDDKGWGGLPAYRAGYRRQAIFITKRIEAVIDRILAESPEPPIILLQSDHGSGLHHEQNDMARTDLRERFSNLCAVYFPDRDYSGLDDGITPVNSFRVILSHFFGADLPRLGRRNLFSTAVDPLAFTDVTDRLDAPGPASGPPPR